MGMIGAFDGATRRTEGRPVWQVWFEGWMASNGSGSRLGLQEKAAQERGESRPEASLIGLHTDVQVDHAQSRAI
jgi:hypothetical protein